MTGLPARWFLAWSETPGVGPATIAKHASGLLPPDPEEDRVREAERLEHAAAAHGERLVGYHDPDYPSGLRDLPAPPPVLWCSGRLPDAPMLAIIGTREPDPRAERAARWSALEALSRGWTTLSGGARGIDIAAHRAGLGRTVCVLGCGLDRPYPDSHAEAFSRIVVDGGCLLSEYPRGTEVHPGRLIARDRIVAAMADAVLPIQAGSRSGTMHAVSVSRSLGRPLAVWDAPWIDDLESLDAVRITRSTLAGWLDEVAAGECRDGR